MRRIFRGRLLALPLLFLPAILAVPTVGCHKDSKPKSKPKSLCDRFFELWKKYEKTLDSVPAD